MGMHHQKGFTIIETLLFLAVSAVLAAALLTGWTAMINTQRYNDSVKTFQTFLQQQYTLVYNVQNGRTLQSSCSVGPSGAPVILDESDIDDGAVAVAPGQSRCIIMGRYIHIENGETIKVYPVVGIDSTVSNSATDTNKEVILDRNPIYVANDAFLAQNELSIPWSAQVVWPRASPFAGQVMNQAIAIIRNPESGTVHTYTGTVASSLRPIAELISAADAAADTRLCLDPGVTLGGGKMGVVIRQDASSASAVQIISDSEDIC